MCERNGEQASLGRVIVGLPDAPLGVAIAYDLECTVAVAHGITVPSGPVKFMVWCHIDGYQHTGTFTVNALSTVPKTVRCVWDSGDTMVCTDGLSRPTLTPSGGWVRLQRSERRA